jgi:hypothetical protein
MLKSATPPPGQDDEVKDATEAGGTRLKEMAERMSSGDPKNDVLNLALLVHGLINLGLAFALMFRPDRVLPGFADQFWHKGDNWNLLHLNTMQVRASPLGLDFV